MSALKKFCFVVKYITCCDLSSDSRRFSFILAGFTVSLVTTRSSFSGFVILCGSSFSGFAVELRWFEGSALLSKSSRLVSCRYEGLRSVIGAVGLSFWEGSSGLSGRCFVAGSSRDLGRWSKRAAISSSYKNR